MSGPFIQVSVQAEVRLSVCEVWPDGDAPEKVTPEAVCEALEATGNKAQALVEWRLLDDAEVLVEVRERQWMTDTAWTHAWETR